jgi:6-pyruvoyltetrahydropterin/6-carboxytetrahydropterin synthase
MVASLKCAALRSGYFSIEDTASSLHCFSASPKGPSRPRRDPLWRNIHFVEPLYFELDRENGDSLFLLGCWCIFGFCGENTFMKSEVKLHLAKQNFKFSAAHFLIFDSKSAEKLHGHNYQVKVDFLVPNSANWKEFGYSVDFKILKDLIKNKVDELDEHVLLPAKHPEIKTSVLASTLHLNFRERVYAFPQNEVHLLPIRNTSVEELSQYLAEAWKNDFLKLGILGFQVFVEETTGQSASYTVSFT